jgi:hypothetical protein
VTQHLRARIAAAIARMRRHTPARIVVGIALILIAAAAAAGGSVEAVQQRQQAVAIHQGNERQQRITGCQIRFNNAYAQVTLLRGRLSDQDRAATKAFNDATASLINFVFTARPGTSRAQVAAQYARYKTAAAAYQRTEARITAMRAANPFPQLPSAACE